MSWIRDKMRKDIQDDLVDILELEAMITNNLVTPIIKNIPQEAITKPIEKTRKRANLSTTKKK